MELTKVLWGSSAAWYGDINKYQFIFITVRMEHYLKMVNISDLAQRGCNNIQLVLLGNEIERKLIIPEMNLKEI